LGMSWFIYIFSPFPSFPCCLCQVDNFVRLGVHEA